VFFYEPLRKYGIDRTYFTAVDDMEQLLRTCGPWIRRTLLKSLKAVVMSVKFVLCARFLNLFLLELVILFLVTCGTVLACASISMRDWGSYSVSLY